MTLDAKLPAFAMQTRGVLRRLAGLEMHQLDLVLNGPSQEVTTG
jgi:hypothetical protein